MRRPRRSERGEGEGAKGRSAAAPFHRFPFAQLVFSYFRHRDTHKLPSLFSPLLLPSASLSSSVCLARLISSLVSSLLSRVALSAVGRGVCRPGDRGVAGYPVAVQPAAHRLFNSGRQKTHEALRLFVSRWLTDGTESGVGQRRQHRHARIQVKRPFPCVFLFRFFPRFTATTPAQELGQHFLTVAARNFPVPPTGKEDDGGKRAGEPHITAAAMSWSLFLSIF